MKFAIVIAGLASAAIVVGVGQQARAGSVADSQSSQTTPLPAPSDSLDADGIVLDRQLVMQQIEKDGEALGKIAAGIEPPTDMAARAKSLAKGAKEARDSFRANVPGGSSRPEVWSNWADFSQRMDRFVAKSDEMATVAQQGDVARISGLLIEAMPCKECHDLYRKKKKDTES